MTRSSIVFFVVLVSFLFVGCEFDTYEPPDNTYQFIEGPLSSEGNVAQGVFQVGLLIDGTVSIVLDPVSVTLDGQTNLNLTTGYYWFFLDTSALVPGDTFTVTTTASGKDTTYTFTII